MPFMLLPLSLAASFLSSSVPYFALACDFTFDMPVK
jgi:hypothetical protein